MTTDPNFLSPICRGDELMFLLSSLTGRGARITMKEMIPDPDSGMMTAWTVARSRTL